MKSLDEAWEWYLSTRKALKLVHRLARNHWDSWDENSPIGRDNNFRNTDGKKLGDETDSAKAHLADFAVFVLFSVFEGEVRELILDRTANERSALRHQVLTNWAKKLEDGLRHGSFGHLLDAVKTTELHDLIEAVSQVRHYRNWVAHGRRGKPQQNVDPSEAYRRLRALLNALQQPPDPSPA